MFSSSSSDEEELPTHTTGRHNRPLSPDPYDHPVIKEKTMAGVPPWPADLRLSLNANNWIEWSRQLITSLEMGQLDAYPLGLLGCPNHRSDKTGYRNWRGNDRMILGFMRSHLFSSEAQCIAHCDTSADAYKTLRRRHEQRSGLTQIQLIQRMMQVRFDHSPANFDATMANLRELIYRAESIGQIDVTKLALLFALMNLRATHPSVHEALAPSLMDGTITLEALERRLSFFYELQATQSMDQLAFPSLVPSNVPFPSSTQSSPSSPTVTLPASYAPRANICPNCKRAGHSIEFCVSPGGKMEGLSTSDAIARQRAARDSPRGPRPPSSSGPTNPFLKVDNDGTVWISGVKYQPASEPAKASIAEVNVEAAMTAADQGEYSDWASNNNDPNWGNNEFLDTATFLLAATNPTLPAHKDMPLYLDSGASTHISCIRSDFSTFRSIEPRMITGVGNSSVSAIGMGTVVIRIPETSACLTLQNVLFAPDAGVRLITISRLDDSGHQLSFAGGRCIVHERSSGRKLAECARNSSHLYVLLGSIHSIPPSIPSFTPCITLPALSVTPNLETWHRRLGHANFRTVLDMARSEVVTGMQADLSLAPQACDACIRGKQTHHPVPKLREGRKADKRLGRVFVDLTGPQSVAARSGCLYIMNVIDDYSGYHWTRLLKTKAEASRALREWLPAAENQSGEKLCYLVTDNGELRSNEIAQWCAERGITHQFTAPHTSAQNGRVERLHRTLMNKARAMRLSCDAPLRLWDEFILTSSYLSNLTTSKAANGRTPHELWFGTRPSLTHLREIGCRAYVFINAPNPKIAAKSIECTLVGYASNAKAYRCWHRESGRIVDSHHVTFVEHLNDQPRVSRTGVDAIAMPRTEDGVTAPTPVPQTAGDDTTSPPLGGTAPPPVPICARLEDQPRRSTRDRVPALSREDTNDGLLHGRATTRALEQVREASSRHAAAKVNAMKPPSADSAEENSSAETTKGTPSGGVTTDEVVLLVDVEDPDAPDWREALESSEREKWLEGANAELTSLQEMGVYELVPRSKVPTDRSVLRGKFVCRLKRGTVGGKGLPTGMGEGFQQNHLTHSPPGIPTCHPTHRRCQRLVY